MPECGTLCITCDLPVRLDTYSGCSHGCAYCFVKRKSNISQIAHGEGPKALAAWLRGERTRDTCWVDWSIPLHWGGVSDPMQPAERDGRLSLACLKLLADSGYPFVMSTKGRLAAEDPYRTLLARCNAAVQISMVSPQYDPREPGAPPWEERLRMCDTLSRSGVMRVIVRVQPYIPSVKHTLIRNLPRLRAAGVHGIIVEGLKSQRPIPGQVRYLGKYMFPTKQLVNDYSEIRYACHRIGLRFYCGENRLRKVGDYRVCCGVDGMPGFRGNTANLMSRVRTYTPAMMSPDSAGCFHSLVQDVGASMKGKSFAEMMEMAAASSSYRDVQGQYPGDADG